MHLEVWNERKSCASGIFEHFIPGTTPTNSSLFITVLESKKLKAWLLPTSRDLRGPSTRVAHGPLFEWSLGPPGPFGPTFFYKLTRNQISCFWSCSCGVSLFESMPHATPHTPSHLDTRIRFRPADRQGPLRTVWSDLWLHSRQLRTSVFSIHFRELTWQSEAERVFVEERMTHILFGCERATLSTITVNHGKSDRYFSASP